jgi:hypothetical protein
MLILKWGTENPMLYIRNVKKCEGPVDLLHTRRVKKAGAIEYLLSRGGSIL